MIAYILDNVSKIAQILLAGLGIIALCVSWGQLKVSRRNNKLNTAKNEIEIFSKLIDKQKAFIMCMFKYNEKMKLCKTPMMRDLAAQEKNDAKQAKDEYFGLLDTVCLYVLNEDITPNNFCKQYKNMLWKLMNLFSNDFDIGKTYENVGKLFKKYENSLLKLD